MKDQLNIEVFLALFVLLLTACEENRGSIIPSGMQ